MCVSVFASSLSIHLSWNKKLEIDNDTLRYFDIIILFDWQKVDFIENDQKLSQVDAKISQNWLCSYQPSMEPTTATPRLFVTTTTTTNMTRRIFTTPWTTTWIHTSISKCFVMNLWHTFGWQYCLNLEFELTFSWYHNDTLLRQLEDASYPKLAK